MITCVERKLKIRKFLWKPIQVINVCLIALMLLSGMIVVCVDVSLQYQPLAFAYTVYLLFNSLLIISMLIIAIYFVTFGIIITYKISKSTQTLRTKAIGRKVVPSEYPFLYSPHSFFSSSRKGYDNCYSGFELEHFNNFRFPLRHFFRI